MELKTIFDGQLRANTIEVSSAFIHGLFLIFDTASLPLSEGIEIGFALVTDIPVIGRVVEKDVILPAEQFQKSLDSFSVIDIPREYSDAGYEMACAFHSSKDVVDFRVYVVTSEVTLESLNIQLEFIQFQLDLIKQILDLILVGLPAQATTSNLSLTGNPPADTLKISSGTGTLLSLPGL